MPGSVKSPGCSKNTPYPNKRNTCRKFARYTETYDYGRVLPIRIFGKG
jgi:hypothetical protein